MRCFIVLAFMLLPTMSVKAQRVQRCQNGLYGLAVSKDNGSIKWLAKPKYAIIEDNGKGSFAVCDKSGLWGIISAAGKEVVTCKYPSKSAAKEAYTFFLNPAAKNYASNHSDSYSSISYADFTLTRDYTQYIKDYVEKKINAWQKKGEFEKTADYQKRVTEANRKMKVEQFTKEVCEECLLKAQDKELRMVLKDYDADNETFLVNTSIGQLVVPVELKNAPSFKANWSKIVSENTYDIVNGKIILRSAIFSLNNKVQATYSDKTHALYAQANVQYNFDPIEVPIPTAKSENQVLITQNNIQIGKSDVDINIPQSDISKDRTFALIFANENYREEIPVNYAINDGNSIEKYFNQTLGIPEKNIHLVRDATKNDMIRELDWLKNVAKVYNHEVDLIVYYAGHGAPNEADGSGYLVPIDGVASNPKTLYPISEFYSELDGVSSNNAIVFLDACFSGAFRGNGMLAAARGVAIKAKPTAPKENMIVFSAAQGDETAWPYSEKSHGLFTYFILKKLQSTKGNVTLGQLATYIADEVNKHSIVVNSKPQTPTVSISTHLSDSWRDIKLK